MITRNFLDGQFKPSLGDLKLHLRITSSDQDALLTTYLKAAISSAEKYIGQKIAKSRFTQTGVIPEDNIINTSSPIISVEKVEVDGKPLTSPSFHYKPGGAEVYLDGYHLTGREVSITYIAGMEKPDYDIIAAVLLIAASLFNNPVDSVKVLPTASSRLLDPFRRYGE